MSGGRPRTTIGTYGGIWTTGRGRRVVSCRDAEERATALATYPAYETVLVEQQIHGPESSVEFLEPTSPQYIADAVTWGAVGARNVESQVHRQLASGLSMPVGFKNATDGDVQIAVDACITATSEHTFFGADPEGRVAAVVREIAERLADGECDITGLMMESFLVEGAQKPGPLDTLTYGQSVTDKCMDWDTTEDLLRLVAKAVRERRG